MKQLALIPVERIEETIYLIRGERVMLDRDLAAMYGVPTKVFNQAAKRHKERFPADFMFQLQPDELRTLRSQIVISNSPSLSNHRGGRRHRPYAFTEQGVAMLSSVLRSPRAIAVNIQIMRAFIRLKRMLDSNAELARRLRALERRYDGRFRMVFEAIRGLMAPPPEKERRAIGFRIAGGHG